MRCRTNCEHGVMALNWKLSSEMLGVLCLDKGFSKWPKNVKEKAANVAACRGYVHAAQETAWHI